MDINLIKGNEDNPRIIKDDKFKKLAKSIKEFPQMLELRPIVVDEDNIVLGGNMRLKACIAAGIKDVPVTIAKNFTEEQKKEFIIKDNISGGEWDWDMLANEWDIGLLDEWGLDMPKFDMPKLDIDDYNDENCEMPIVPKFLEHYECFVIPISNTIDEQFIRDVFNLNENYIAESGDKKIRKTNLIDVNLVRAVINERD